jgi:hypothetical protein
MELVLVCGQATSAGSCTPPAHQPSRTRRRSARTGTARRGALRHRHARTQCPPAGRRRSGAMSEPHTGPWRGRRPPPCARPWCTPLGLARWPSPRQAAPRTATNSSAARLLAAPSAPSARPRPRPEAQKLADLIKRISRGNRTMSSNPECLPLRTPHARGRASDLRRRGTTGDGATPLLATATVRAVRSSSPESFCTER